RDRSDQRDAHGDCRVRRRPPRRSRVHGPDHGVRRRGPSRRPPARHRLRRLGDELAVGADRRAADRGPATRVPRRDVAEPPVGAALGAVALVVAFMVGAWRTSTWTTPGTPAVVGVLVPIGGLAVLVGAVGAFAALGVRWHRTDPVRRQPFRVVGTTAALLAL